MVVMIVVAVVGAGVRVRLAGMMVLVLRGMPIRSVVVLVLAGVDVVVVVMFVLVLVTVVAVMMFVGRGVSVVSMMVFMLVNVRRIRGAGAAEQEEDDGDERSISHEISPE